MIFTVYCHLEGKLAKFEAPGETIEEAINLVKKETGAQRAFVLIK